MKSKQLALYLSLLNLVLLVASAICLWAAFEYPLVVGHFRLQLPNWIPNFAGLHNKLHDYIIDYAQLQIGPQYLLETIRSLFRSGETVLGMAILFFSILFPGLKIVVSLLATFATRWRASTRNKLASTIGLVSKWSMGDVFVVALLIVLFKAEGLSYYLTAAPGIYWYAAAAFLSTASGYIARLIVAKQTSDLSNKN